MAARSVPTPIGCSDGQNESGRAQAYTPERAKKMCLNARKGEVSQSTLDGYHYRLNHFIRWCDERGIEKRNELSGRKLQHFRTWRRDDGDLEPVTLEGNLDALRVFIRWCESIDTVVQGLHETIIIPTLSKEDEQAEIILSKEQAEAVLEYLQQYECVTRGHAIIELLWYTGIRFGALHSLGLKDYDSERETLALHHPPETGTVLKNGKASVSSL